MQSLKGDLERPIPKNTPLVSQRTSVTSKRRVDRIRKRVSPKRLILIFLLLLIFIFSGYVLWIIMTSYNQEKKDEQKIKEILKNAKKPIPLKIGETISLENYPSKTLKVKIKCEQKCRCIIWRDQNPEITKKIFWSLKPEKIALPYEILEINNLKSETKNEKKEEKEKENEIIEETLIFSPSNVYYYTLGCAQSSIESNLITSENSEELSSEVVILGNDLILIDSVKRILEKFNLYGENLKLNKNQTVIPKEFNFFSSNMKESETSENIIENENSQKIKKNQKLKKVCSEKTKLKDFCLETRKNGLVIIKGIIPRSFHLKCAFMQADESLSDTKILENTNEIIIKEIDSKIGIFNLKSDFSSFEKRIYISERFADDPIDKNNFSPVKFELRRIGLVDGVYSFYCSAFNVRPERLKEVVENRFNIEGKSFIFKDRLVAKGEFGIYSKDEKKALVDIESSEIKEKENENDDFFDAKESFEDDGKERDIESAENVKEEEEEEEKFESVEENSSNDESDNKDGNEKEKIEKEEKEKTISKPNISEKEGGKDEVLRNSFIIGKFENIFSILQKDSSQSDGKVNSSKIQEKAFNYLQKISNGFLFEDSFLKEINPKISKNALFAGLSFAKSLTVLSRIKIDLIAPFNYTFISFFEKSVYYFEDIFTNKNYSSNILNLSKMDKESKNDSEDVEAVEVGKMEGKNKIYNSFNRLFYNITVLTKIFNHMELIGLNKMFYERSINDIWKNFAVLVNCEENFNLDCFVGEKVTKGKGEEEEGKFFEIIAKWGGDNVYEILGIKDKRNKLKEKLKFHDRKEVKLF